MVRDPKTSSTVGGILLVRMKVFKNYDVNSKKQQPNSKTEYSPATLRSNSFVNEADIDHFPNPTLIYLPEENEAAAVHGSVEYIPNDAFSQGFPEERFDDLRKIIMDVLGVFCNDFSQLAAEIPPLKVELKPDAKSIHVNISNYSDS